MNGWEAQLRTWVRTACAMEVMCPKPGNVHPDQAFADATVVDFLKSADAIAPPLSTAETQPVGRTILNCIQATRAQVSTNTNLGIVLLLAPLAAVPRGLPLADGINLVLQSLTVQDAIDAYAAIRLASPGGLGSARAQDVHDLPTQNLLQCMRLAADRDQIAAQYAGSFTQVLQEGRHWLQSAEQQIPRQPQQIAWVAIQLLSQYGDTLIRRKCGPSTDDAARDQAGRVLQAGWPHTTHGEAEFRRLDEFLRSDGHRRNPGTTADLIAAILFAGLRDGWLTPRGDWWLHKDFSA